MNRFLSIPYDVQEFLDGYPYDDPDDEDKRHLNLRFYSNEIKCIPEGLLIEEFLDQWKGKYDQLEGSHSFIQWLFPIPEQGVNFSARPLTTHEIERINSSPDLLSRLKRSYELMLDFYGMKLIDAESGLVGRKDQGWEARYQNLSYQGHNYQRISRILKCLSILSYPHYAAPFVLHVLNEQSEHGQLDNPTLRSSLDRWWANCNKNEQERGTVQSIIARVRDKSNKWTFTRATYEQMIHARTTTGSLTLPD